MSIEDLDGMAEKIQKIRKAKVRRALWLQCLAKAMLGGGSRYALVVWVLDRLLGLPGGRAGSLQSL